MEAVNQPEFLSRGMYGAKVDRPEITQDNDIDTPFETDVPQGIPADLMALIHQAPSVDPEPEGEIVQGEIDVEKVTEENPQSRFRLVNVPVLSPGTCILCKSAGGDGRQFIDLAVQVTWVGALYFCTFCITEAAKLIGLDQTYSFEDAKEKLRVQNSDLARELVNSSEQLSAYRVLLRDHLNGDCAPVTEPIVDADIVEGTPEPEPDDSESNESPGEQGSDDLPSSASYDELVELVSKKPSRRRTTKSAE